MAGKQKKDGDEGFLVELIDMLNADHANRSIPSEGPFPEESFTDRMPSEFGAFTEEGFNVQRQTLDIGNKIVMGNLLKQFNSIPSATANSTFEFQNDPELSDIIEKQDPKAFPSSDIFNFLFNEKSTIDPTQNKADMNTRSTMDKVFGVKI